MARLITERDVRQAAADEKPLEIGSDTVITPSARDLAAELGVSTRRAGAHSLEEECPVGTVALGSDHGGFALKGHLAELLEREGYRVADVGCGGSDPVDYPVYAARVAEKVSGGDTEFGIMIDGAGIGSAMVGNRFPGVRAALCYDLTTAGNAREHNNANMLTLGAGMIGSRLAAEITLAFLRTPFAGGRHLRRVAMIDALDSGDPS